MAWGPRAVALEPADVTTVHDHDEVASLEPGGVELACVVGERSVAVALQCSAGPAVHVESGVGRDAGGVDLDQSTQPPCRGLLAKDRLGHGRAAYVARADETDPKRHPAIVASRARLGQNARLDMARLEGSPRTSPTHRKGQLART